MYEHITEVINTRTKWFQEKPDGYDMYIFDDLFNRRAAEGWELVTYSYIATFLETRGALLVTFRRKEQ